MSSCVASRLLSRLGVPRTRIQTGLSRYSPNVPIQEEITLEGEELLIMREDEVLAVINGETKKRK